MKNKTIGNPLVNPKSNVVTYSDQVKDLASGKRQDELNSELAESLSSVQETVGSIAEAIGSGSVGHNTYDLYYNAYDDSIYLPQGNYSFNIGDVLRFVPSTPETPEPGPKGMTKKVDEPDFNETYVIIIQPVSYETPTKGEGTKVAPDTYSVGTCAIFSCYANEMCSLGAVTFTDGTYTTDGSDSVSAVIISMDF